MATKIHCPTCEWRPSARDRWMCVPTCATIWNTFDTHGKCPGCAKQWTVTACLACGVYSPHEAWYHDEAPERADVEQGVNEYEEELVGTGA
jgi:hypothetical protein